MHLFSELYPCVGPQYTNTRWGQILDFSSLYGLVEIFSSGNAQEEGVATVTRLNRILSETSKFPKLSILKKKIDLKAIKSLLLCRNVEGQCELVLLGDGKIFLRRGKMIAPLLVREGVLSGEIRSGDCLIFLSQTALQIIANEQKELFSLGLTPKEIAEAFRIRFSQEKEKGEGAAALVVEIKQEVRTPPTRSVSTPKISIQQKIRNHIERLAQIRNRPKFYPYLVISVVAILFLMSVFLGVRRQQNDTVYKHRQEAITQAQKLFDEGVALNDLQPIKSRENFQSALQLLEPYTGKNLPKGKEAKTIESLEDQINDSLKLVSKVYSVNPQLFYDATFLQKDRSVSQFTVGEDELAFADTNSGMIAVVSLSSKDAEIVAGGSEYSSTKFMTFENSRLLLVTNDGVKAVEPGKDDVKTLLKPQETWDAFTTFGGNLYGVNKSAGEIYRYPAKESGFGSKESYLAEDLHSDLSHITSIHIDGSIWLGSTIGKIFRYTQNRDDPFLIRGVDPVLGQNVDVFVNEDSPYVYVFDPEEKRVVILNKEGTYQNQYVYGDTIHPTAFGVAPTKKRVYLLADKKIYSFEIN